MSLTELSPGISLVLIGTLAVGCYYPTIQGEFVFDDSEAVMNNGDVSLSSPLANIFKNDFWGTLITHNASHKSYRPLTVLSFRLNALLSGGALVASHFRSVNLVLYCVICCLSLSVFKCMSFRNSTSSNQVALLASVLFTVHPIHTEAVGPVVGRADLLCALFLFCGFLTFCRAVRSESVLFTSLTVVFAALSMFCKEQGITLLGICLVYNTISTLPMEQVLNLLTWKAWRVSKFQKFLVRQAILTAGGIILLLLRWKVMGGTVPTFQPVDNPASFMDDPFYRVLNYTYVYALNLWLLFCPEWLCFDWSMGCVPLIRSLNDVRIVFIFLFVLFFTLLVFLGVKHPRLQSREKLMSITFLVLPFLPASNILFRVGFVVAERALFVPSVGFCFLVALGLHRLWSVSCKNFRVLPPVLLICMLTVFCVRSHVRTTEWRDERTLFLSALAICPLNAKVHYNVAKTSPNNTGAMRHYRLALRLNPEYDQAMNNLANILKDNGELLEAETLLRRALELRPDFAAAWMNLGIVLANMKNFDEAEKCYKNAIKHRTRYPDCYYNLGNLYLELKQFTKAYESWRQATLLEPTHHAAWNNLIIMLDSIGKHSEAAEVGREALTVLPNSASIHFNIANSLGKTSDFTAAEQHFKQAIRLNPHHPLYYVNLGVLYHHWKKFNLARDHYLQALKLDPNLKSAKANLRNLDKNNL